MWHFRLSGTKFLSTFPRLPAAELSYFCFILETLQNMFHFCSDILETNPGGLLNNNNVMIASKFLLKSAIFIGYIVWRSISLSDILNSAGMVLENHCQRFINLNIKPFSQTEGKGAISNSMPNSMSCHNDRMLDYIDTFITIF